MKINTNMKRAGMILGLLAVLAMATDAIAAKAPPEKAVNINTASAEELTTVPGIGEAKARAIVEYRSSQKFTSTEDLMNVKGIGEKLYAKVAPYVTVSGSKVSNETGAAAGSAR
jgi:competence protein ComEA